MARPTLKTFKKEALKKEGMKKAYDELSPAYEIRKKLISLIDSASTNATLL